MPRRKTTSNESREPSPNSTPSSSSASSDATPSTLTWEKPDAYHIRTACGRYTVAKVVLGKFVDYVAWCCAPSTAPPLEIAAARVLASAGEDEALKAIQSMRRKCLEHLSASAK